MIRYCTLIILLLIVAAHSSYRDIPGVTAKEIEAIEKLKKKRDFFIYGMNPSTETFLDESGKINGFSALFCEWLSELFGIRFVPEFLHSANLAEIVQKGRIDFSGDVKVTEERRKFILATDPIALRSIKMFRLKDSPSIKDIAQTRLPRYAFIKETVSVADVAAVTEPGSYEALEFDILEDFYKVLQSGTADAFVGLNPLESLFDKYDDIVIKDFLPLIFSPVSMITAKPELEPIISVVQKAIENGATAHLTELYNQGYSKYKKHKFFASLNEEEKTYIQNTDTVPVAAQYFNYPIIFYDKHKGKWDGIVVDLLNEVEKLSGLSFKIVNNKNTEMRELIQILSDGRAHIFSDLVLSEERAPFFIWGDYKIKKDQYALLSKADFPNVNANEIPYARVALIKNTAHAEMFRTWFPHAINAVEYNNTDSAFLALEQGKVDFVMASLSKLLYYANYFEFSGYKANYTFDYHYNSSLAFNKDQTTLKSITDKALSVIHTERIVSQWLTKTYDYEKKLTEQRSNFMKQLFLIMAVSIAVLCLFLTKLILLLIKNNKLRKQRITHLEKLQTILDMLPVGVRIMRLKDGALLYANKASLKVFNCNSFEDQVADQSGFTFMPEYQPDGRKTSDVVAEFFQKKASTIEMQCLKLGGEPFTARITSCIIDYQGEPSSLATIENASEIRDAERMVSEHIKIMMNTMPLICNLWSKEGKVIDCNEAALKLFDIKDKETYFENFLKLAPEVQPDGKTTTAEIAIRELTKVFEEGKAEFEYVAQKLDGTPIPQRVTLTRVPYKGDYIAVGYGYDLREEKQMAEEIKVMFKNAPVGLTVFDENFKFIDCNEAVLKIYGVTREFYSNFFGSAAHSPEFQPDGSKSYDKAMEVVKRVMEGETMRIEWVHCMPDGEPLPTELTMVRVNRDGKYVGLGYIYDMREQIRLKEEIRTALIKTQEASRAKSDFLATISHEIRTPMNAILGLTEIQLQNKLLPRGTRESLSVIYNSGDSLLRIINDLLDLSKIEAKKLEIIPVEYDVASLINDTALLNMMRIESKPIEFKLNVDENIPTILFGDELRIKQVLNNVLSNAFKYTDSGEVSMSVSFDTGLIFRISDTGRGMTKEQIRKIFDKYSRFSLTGNNEVEGTGLGMGITQGLVSLMEGTISVESEPGKGSVFTICLPQKTVGTKVLGKELAENLQKFRISSESQTKKINIIREPMPYGKVLVVDDVESNLYVAKQLLDPYELSVDLATSGFEAIEKIQSGKVYDIVLMDHMMPKMDGIETVKRMREMGYDHPIIALTANAVIGQAEVFLENGFDSFISKPVDTVLLNTELNKFIRDKKSPEALSKSHKSDAILYSTFAKDAKKALPTFEWTLKNIDSISDDDLQLFSIKVHGIKSALANIGKTEASKLAFTLENAGKKHDKAVIKAQTQRLIDTLQVIVSEIEAREDAIADHDENPEYLRKQLEVIKEACTYYNIKAACAALDNLKEMSWTRETKVFLEKIEEHLLQSDFEEVEVEITDFV
ncbi:MAG: transporter substrate-binding domain-containing protein [Fibromonadaceae bacterium]|jgi:CheY-like chemotaxis protein/HPt (histidine-containing phosphotransfer) domain-containing protein|nr:transporter substrate-binding domain-containing protein [Fibromonadaceae bacterium]